MKKLPLILGILSFVAAIVMKQVGESSSHLSELADYWWTPLPLAALLVLYALKKDKKTNNN